MVSVNIEHGYFTMRRRCGSSMSCGPGISRHQFVLLLLSILSTQLTLCGLVALPRNFSVFVVLRVLVFFPVNMCVCVLVCIISNQFQFQLVTSEKF